MAPAERVLGLALPFCIGILVLIGVASSLGRVMFPGTLGARVEPVRQRISDSVVPPERMEEVRRLEQRFVDHRAATLLHVGPGALFLLLAPLQFVRGFRTRHIAVHRWSGRVLVLTGVITVMAGLYFGVWIPAAGIEESIVIAAVSALFLLSLTKAVLAIRRRDVERHREWMIRAFAVGLGISTVRIVAAIADAVLTPAGYALETLFVLSLALGWLITIAAAELWIVRSHGVSRSPFSPMSRRTPDRIRSSRYR